MGEELHARMKAKGVSQKEIAEEMDATQPQISRILSGKFTRSELARRLCERFDVAPPNAHISAADRALDDAKQSLHRIWDGTAPGARQLSELLKAVRSVSLRKTSR